MICPYQSGCWIDQLGSPRRQPNPTSRSLHHSSFRAVRNARGCRPRFRGL